MRTAKAAGTSLEVKHRQPPNTPTAKCANRQTRKKATHVVDSVTETRHSCSLYKSGPVLCASAYQTTAGGHLFYGTTSARRFSALILISTETPQSWQRFLINISRKSSRKPWIFWPPSGRSRHTGKRMASSFEHTKDARASGERRGVCRQRNCDVTSVAHQSGTAACSVYDRCEREVASNLGSWANAIHTVAIHAGCFQPWKLFACKAGTKFFKAAFCVENLKKFWAFWRTFEFDTLTRSQWQRYYEIGIETAASIWTRLQDCGCAVLREIHLLFKNFCWWLKPAAFVESSYFKNKAD